MFKTIVFNGGLGNQMFQYALYLRLKKEHPLSVFLFDIEKSQECHNGYELDKVFQIDSTTQARNYRRLIRHCSNIEKKFHTVKQEYSLRFEQDILRSGHLLTKYEGFWQSERYFLPVKQDVQESFSFNIDHLNNETQAISQEITGKESVSVHIRRGDYLNSSDFGLCTIDYYNKVMSFMTEKVNNPTFIFFSDDMDWVKSHIPCNNGIYVSCNQGPDSWQDMYLMTRCKHNIIANSSFSWWGAWLNNNPKKIVIAPEQWFNYSPNYDILPNGWITLKKQIYEPCADSSFCL